MKITRFLPLVVAVCLQIFPMVRTVLPVAERIGPGSWSMVLRMAAGVAALLGSFHAVSAATAILAPYTVNATNGVRFVRQLGTSTRTAYSWSANTAPLFSAVYPLTGGLYLTNASGRIGGVPSWSGTSNITITAWEYTGNSGHQVSSIFTFTITGGSGPPTIAVPPASQSVLRGATATLSVGATGSDPLTYRWQYNGGDISGAAAASLTLTNVQPANAGSYTVIVSNSLGSVSSTAQLTVLTPPTISVPPVAQTVSPGANVSFEAAVTGTAPLSFRWQFNGANIFGATNNTLQLLAVQSSNAGTYTVVVSNPYGVATNSAILTVNGPPAITAQPQSRAVGNGASATFNVLAGGEAPLSFQWRREGVDLPGKTNASLVVTGASTADAGRYSVVVSNPLGSVASADAFLRISFGVTTTVNPLYRLTNVWRYDQTGDYLGTAWREFDFNDSLWPSGPGILAVEDTGNPVVFPLIGTTLSLTYGGTFVTNYYFRTHFTLTNKAQLSTLIFSNAIDDGAIFYLNGTEIFRNNMPAGPANNTTLASVSATEGVFVINNVAGTLAVEGDNVIAAEVHQVSATSSDIVLGAALFGSFGIPRTVPIILTNPVDITAAAGVNVTLLAAVDGTGPLGYQWFKDGSAVASGNSTTLLLPSVTGDAAGGYSIVASNQFGSATSRVAQVTVSSPNSAPVITAVPDQFVRQGDLFSISIQAVDHDLPAQTLTFSLALGAPVGAVINPLTGLLTWPTAGAASPSTNTLTVFAADNGSPSLSGLTTFRVIVSGNRPPVLQAIPNVTAQVMVPLVVTNSATDPDGASAQLVYSLGAGAPAGAQIQPGKGIFVWRPTQAQAASTNLITVIVTDAGSPPLSDSKTFQVIVADSVEVSLSSAVVATGGSSNLTVSLASSASISNLHFALNFSGDLTGWTVQPAAGVVAQAVLSGVTSNRLVVDVTASPALPSTGQPLVQLGFSVPGSLASDFIGLSFTEVSNLRGDGSHVERMLLHDGRVVVVGDAPLIEALAGTNSPRSVMIYGRSGSTHFVDQAGSLIAPVQWSNGWQHTFGDLSHVLSVGSAGSSNSFYRIR